MSESLQKTPLNEIHVALGARMTPFAGFEMPVQYPGGIINEHLAVREKAGLFDVSHMGEVLVRGPEAFHFVQRLITNDATRLYDGRAMYTVMCRPSGGIVDDLLVYRFSSEEYMLVLNAANIGKDLRWMREHAIDGAEIVDQSNETALLAIQGPLSHDIVSRIDGADLASLKSYHFMRPDEFAGHRNIVLSYTGYTGERGLEIYCPSDAAADIWTALMDAGEPDGLQPCGLGARDTLRLEAGLSLYGNDITEETNPLEAGLGWLVKSDKGDFIGRDAIEQIRAAGIERKLVGFVLEERGVPRTGLEIVAEDETPIGVVTSGTQSPVLKQGIGLGYVLNDPRFTVEGATIRVMSRGRALRATVTRPPFHKK